MPGEDEDDDDVDRSLVFDEVDSSRILLTLKLRLFFDVTTFVGAGCGGVESVFSTAFADSVFGVGC